ncbi:hypothetical protein sos41_04490 [Alphaproteobacteria bacterium SO-S41]|nr:hypothetical protein sos41_04490 [Alphaproteobacteria bacterium SO-S41]
MKTLPGLLAATVAGLAFFGAGPSLSEPGRFEFTATAEARGRTSVSFSVFYDQLQPYGRWVNYGRYGQVWVPHRQRNWRPYTVGRWVNTRDYGWMWSSAEPFGWATYHYGSWDYDRRLGWYWVPGYVWGPAWVTWSDQGDYLGWAPIPSSYLWGNAFNDFFSYRPIIQIVYRDSWCYAPRRHLGDRRIDRHVVPAQQNVTIVNNNTTVVNNITNVTIVDNRVYNYGVSVDAVNAVAETPIETVTVTEATAPNAGGDAAGPGVVEVYRPVETPIADDPAVIEQIATEQTTVATETANGPTEPLPAQPDVTVPPADATEIGRIAPAVPEAQPGEQPLEAAIAPTAPLPAEPGADAVIPDVPQDTTVPPAPDAAYTPPAEAYVTPEAPVYEAPVEAVTPQEPVYEAPAETIPAPAPEPTYDAPVEAYAPPSEPAYEAPVETYTAPEPTYEPPAETYAAPEPSYEQPAETYTAPEPAYEQPAPPEPSYEAPQAEAYVAPEPAYEAPVESYTPPEPAYEPPPAPVYEAPPPPPAPEPPPPAETTTNQ